MSKLEAVVGGETFTLSADLVLEHLGNTGFGLPPVNRNTERGPYQHGETNKGFRLAPRTIQLVLLAYGDSEAAYFTQRDFLLYLFSPSDEPIKLRLTTPNGQRQIDCYYSGGLELPSSERYAHSQRVAVSLFAPDPTFYDPTTTTLSFGISATGGALNIPLVVPMMVGSAELNQTIAVSYGGTWDTYPVVTIYGPITNPVITNETTGDILDFTGTIIPNGDWYTIDTRYGSKRVYRNGSLDDNRVYQLSSDSDLATFRIARKPTAPDGINVFRVSGTGANQTTQVYLSYNTRYIGV